MQYEEDDSLDIDEDDDEWEEYYEDEESEEDADDADWEEELESIGESVEEELTKPTRESSITD